MKQEYPVLFYRVQGTWSEFWYGGPCQVEVLLAIRETYGAAVDSLDHRHETLLRLVVQAIVPPVDARSLNAPMRCREQERVSKKVLLQDEAHKKMIGSTSHLNGSVPGVATTIALIGVAEIERDVVGVAWSETFLPRRAEVAFVLQLLGSRSPDFFHPTELTRLVCEVGKEHCDLIPRVDAPL
ncbi:hypothetical protein D3C86_1167130 [compost metagenome]